MLIKLTPEKLLQLGTDIPETNLILWGWEYEIHYFLWTIPYIIYSKALYNKN
jgi:hypothetical protein